ncbi:MAG: acyltransferase [Methylibium sp. NZG]|nr:MAG: acyltransferase [Methylibium sp. NZG]
MVAATALGGLHSLSFAADRRWWLQLAALAALVWLLRAAGVARAAALGLAFGTAWLVGSVWWLFISMHRYGGLPAWMAALAVLLLSAFMAVFLAAAMAGFARWRLCRPLPDALLLAALWLLAELARGALFTGFPWAASGYAHVEGPLASLAPWLGVYGIGFAAAWLAALPVLAWTDSAARAARVAGARGDRGEDTGGVDDDKKAVEAAARASRGHRGTAIGATLGVAAALALLGWAPPANFTQPTGTLKVSLLQGNVPQDEKFSIAHLPEALAWTRSALLSAQGDLVVGPETVVPLLPAQLDPAWWAELLAHFRTGQRAALLGLPLGDEVQGYTNSVAGISAASASEPGGFYRYDKHHLVPFGEFIPPGFRWFTEMMNIPLGDFNRGVLGAPAFAVRGERVAPNICYEDLFGEELAVGFANAATAPTILANVSNIGWFGQTIAVGQHLAISRMRALELQRPMLRATNTGATVVIDHRGVVTHALPPHTQGVLEATVQGRTGITPFAWWAARTGLWLPAAFALLVVLAVARGRRVAVIGR